MREGGGYVSTNQWFFHQWLVNHSKCNFYTKTQLYLLIVIYYQRETGVDEDSVRDSRQWTREHLEAANIPHPSINALTPPQDDALGGNPSVDVRGPGE